MEPKEVGDSFVRFLNEYICSQECPFPANYRFKLKREFFSQDLRIVLAQEGLLGLLDKTIATLEQRDGKIIIDIPSYHTFPNDGEIKPQRLEFSVNDTGFRGSFGSQFWYNFPEARWEFTTDRKC